MKAIIAIRFSFDKWKNRTNFLLKKRQYSKKNIYKIVYILSINYIFLCYSQNKTEKKASTFILTV